MKGVVGVNIKLLEVQKLKGERVYLKRFSILDVTQRYVDWLNDPEVNRFLSVRGIPQTIDMVREYVASYEGEKNKLLLGIFDKTNDLHIGNITFTIIQQNGHLGIIGIAIGDKNYWRGGYATEALNLVVNFGFSTLKLHRLEAGMSVENIASQKLFKKAGFKQEGVLKERGKIGDRYVDDFIFGLVRNQK